MTRGATTPAEATLTDEERRTLVRVARAAIVARFSGRPLDSEEVGAHPTLREKRGAFVTLHAAETGELRGCIGRLESDDSLVDTVAQMAVAAATADGRFTPVTASELNEIRIEVSALGPLRRVRPEDVVVGRHGLVLSLRGRRGVLLPQVPIEYGWDLDTFLDHTCVKAGLPPGSWLDEGAELLAFTAEVFGEGSEG